MSEEIDELRTGGLQRILLVMAVLAAVMVALVWARASQDRGEPEQAHRVLIVGGTPTDLVEAIAEAGFEGTQISWAEAQTQCANSDGILDRDALIDCADERGDGFVALIYGDDMALFGETVPEHTDVAVISVGELASDEQPTTHFGTAPLGLDYAPGMRRSEAMRMALYQHPDLLALWDEPTAEQIGQQVQLADLDEARTLLERAVARYEAAKLAWPSDWPDGAIMEPWTEIEGMAVLGGRVVREIELTRWVDERRTPELRRGPTRLRFVPDQGPAITTTIDPTVEQLVAPDRGAGLQRTDAGWLRWRIEAGKPKVEAEVERELALVLEQEFHPRAWLEDQLVVDATMIWVIDERPALEVMNFVDVSAKGQPRMVGLPLTALPPAIDAELESLHSTTAGLHMVLVRDEAKLLVRVDLDLALVRAAMIAIPGDPPVLDMEATIAGMRTAAELGVSAVELGMLPSFEHGSLVVAPDGTWIAWRSPGRARAIWAAAIVEGKLATPVRLGEGSMDPQISADSQTVLLTVERELGELGPVHTLRIVARPRP